jgi:hypothetical protein
MKTYWGSWDIAPRILCPRHSSSSSSSSVVLQFLNTLATSHILNLYVRFRNKKLLWGGVVSTTPNPNLEDQWTTLSLACVTLPETYAPASIALGVIRARKPPHPQHVLRQGDSPWGSDLGTRWKWVISFTPRPLCPQEKGPRYTLDRRLRRPQNRSGHSVEEKISNPHRESNPDHSFVQPVASHYTDWTNPALASNQKETLTGRYFIVR